MRCECYRVGGPFIAEDPNGPIHGYEAQAREKEERAYRESEEEKQNELLARIIALEEKIDAMPQCTQPVPSIPESWKQLVKELVFEVERKTCTHEETYRGGFMWEICESCGAKWADDEGGKPEFKWPKVVEKARDMLAAAPEVKP